MTLRVPSDYDFTQAHPLLVVLHGYGASGFLQTMYLGLDRLVEEEGVLLASPDGTVDPDEMPFWSATDACCDFYESGVDDVGYITGLVADISVEYNVDPKRIYLLGHSNGGFMSYRLACDRAEVFAAIASLAGATFTDASQCSPSEPVSVLQIHGVADDIVLYDGYAQGASLLERPYPGAKASVELWRGYNGCSGPVSEEAPPLSVVGTGQGGETKRLRATGCPANVGVELWSIEKGTHLPPVNRDFPGEVWAWMSAHPKP